jgi:hypothetical protein
MSNPRGVRPVRTGKTTEGSGRGKKIAVATILLLLVAAGAFAMYRGEDPGVARIEAIRQQMDGATDEQRRELFQKMRQEYEQLPEATRDRLREERNAQREREDGQRMAKFFAMSPQEQQKALDERIKQEEKWRKERAQRRGPGGGGSRGGPGAGGGGRGGRGGNGSGDPNARRKSYLDNSSPQSRAMRSEYYRMRAERRQQLGLSSR